MSDLIKEVLHLVHDCMCNAKQGPGTPQLLCELDNNIGNHPSLYITLHSCTFSFPFSNYIYLKNYIVLHFYLFMFYVVRQVQVTTLQYMAKNPKTVTVQI